MTDIYSKSQYAKPKWDGAVDPTFNHSYKTDNRKV